MKYVSAEEYCERKVKTEDCARGEGREREKKNSRGRGEMIIIKKKMKKCITKQLIRFLVFSVSVIYIISKTLRNAMEAGFILCALFP